MRPSPPTGDFSRAHHLARLREVGQVDVLVIGGGATGLGVALDAAARGWTVALFEAHDFAEGTSSRSTKLLHGGVRYLSQGRWPLVREALHERATLLSLAPHLAQPLPFLLPTHSWSKALIYGLGLRLYDGLAGSHRLSRMQVLSGRAARDLVPNLRSPHLRCALKYWDAQFDDARFALALARTAADQGALLLNHCPVIGFEQERGRVIGVVVSERYSGQTWAVRSRCIVNATGVWADETERMLAQSEPSHHLKPSQGAHLVVDRRFLPGEHAVLSPRTRDGRVLFAIPWLGKMLLGTTDTPCDRISIEPQATGQEIDFILNEAGQLLCDTPTRADVRSAWVGLRPLVSHGGQKAATASLSREHAIWTTSQGLISVTGGKWTTYRLMAEQVMAHCQRTGRLDPRPPVTATIPLRGCPAPGVAPFTSIADWPSALAYGSDAAQLNSMPGCEAALWVEDGKPCLTEAMVRYAVRHEMACSVADVLARRSRLLFLDAQKALDLAAQVGAVMAAEMGPEFDEGASVEQAQELARQYRAV